MDKKNGSILKVKFILTNNYAEGEVLLFHFKLSKTLKGLQSTNTWHELDLIRPKFEIYFAQNCITKSCLNLLDVKFEHCRKR